MKMDIIIIGIDHFLVALFSALKQTLAHTGLFLFFS